MSQLSKSMSAPKLFFALLTSAVIWGCGDAPPPQIQNSYQTGPEEKPAALTAQINTSPLFESANGWGGGFAKAKVDSNGVVVGPGGDNPNVFAQQFPAKPSDQFKIVARAASMPGSPAKGRFQINWLDRSYQFVSVSIKAFDVVPEEKAFEFHVTAPANTAYGTVYVVPDGKDDVIRYTEMRVLGNAAPVTK